MFLGLIICTIRRGDTQGRTAGLICGLRCFFGCVDSLWPTILSPQECEPAVGRLLVFCVEGQGAERKVSLVAEEETRGSVYVLNGFNGKLLAGINSKVCKFGFGGLLCVSHVFSPSLAVSSLLVATQFIVSV